MQTDPVLPTDPAWVHHTSCKPEHPGKASPIPAHLLAESSQPPTHGNLLGFPDAAPLPDSRSCPPKSSVVLSLSGVLEAHSPTTVSSQGVRGGRPSSRRAEHLMSTEKELMIEKASAHGPCLCSFAPESFSLSAPFLSGDPHTWHLALVSSGLGDSWQCLEGRGCVSVTGSLPRAWHKEHSGMFIG